MQQLMQLLLTVMLPYACCSRQRRHVRCGLLTDSVCLRCRKYYAFDIEWASGAVFRCPFMSDGCPLGSAFLGSNWAHGARTDLTALTDNDSSFCVMSRGQCRSRRMICNKTLACNVRFSVDAESRLLDGTLA